MGIKCGACGHEHTGPELAFICIGCPCPAQPGREQRREEDSPTSDPDFDSDPDDGGD